MKLQLRSTHGISGPVFAIALAVIAFSEVTARAEQTDSLSSLSTSFQELSQRITPAVVQIFVSGYGPVDELGAQGSGAIGKQRGIGSGVILDAGGYIVTNAHVVEGAHRVRVVLPVTSEEHVRRRSVLKGSGRIVSGEIVGIDRETDLAVVKVEEEGLSALELDDSDDLQQGEIVLAFGSPMGLQNSVTMGVVSSVARQLRPEDPVVYIQTDATINPGNSGGPLVNTRGRVVGINTLILSQSGGSEGIGFAVPSNIVKNVFEQIRTSGRVRRGQIGVNAQTISSVLARGLRLPRTDGVILADVYPGGPADRAGLRVGDIVLTLNGKPMENGRQLDVNLYRRRIGETVTIEFLRNDKRRTVDVAVVERPDDPERLAALVRPKKNLIPKLGILVLDLDQSIAAMLPQLRSRTGVAVAARDASGPVWRNAFQPGDVIYAINGKRIRRSSELRTITQQLGVGDAVVVQLQRGPQLQYIAFEID